MIFFEKENRSKSYFAPTWCEKQDLNLHEVAITTDLNRSASANSAILALNWWMGMDSNHRSLRRQIYSLLPLATREPIHMNDSALVELVMGLEPATF